MADRYWVGGTDSWDATVGTKWAATSGGAGGESVPTIADDVFFDANSTGTVTINRAAASTVAKSINCTGFVGTITGTGIPGGFTVGGSVTLVAGMTYTNTGTATFTGTGTLITAGKVFSGVTVNGSGITLTLGDALSIANRAVTVTEGTFDTAGYNVTGGALSSSNTNTRAITLGASTLTISGGSGIEFSTSTNLTFNAGTSQITMTAVNAMLRGGSLTFYNVSLTNAGQTKQIIGANTFNDLSLPTNGISVILDNQTVSGTFTCIGNSATQRAFLRSDTIGTTRTITAAVVSANDCDFRDITIAGAAAPISPTRASNCGGNSGITFPAAKTVYRVGINTSWGGASSWALTSGGAGSNDNFPLAQDTAVIDESTALTGTLNCNFRNTGAVDCSTRTTGITLNFNTAISRYGSLILGSGITVTGTSANTFSGRSTMALTSAGKTITFPIVVDAPSGALQLGDALTASSTITNTLGTLDANSYNLTCTTFASSNSNTRTITMGSGLWTLSGTGTVWTTDTTTGLTFNKDTANILLSDTSGTARTFNGGGLSYNKLTIGGATGTSTLTIGGANSFTELASDKTVAHTITLNSNQGTIDTWTVTGTSGNVVTLNSSSAGTRRTFTLTNATGSIETPSSIDYLAVQDIGELSGNKFFVGINSTNNGNNSNVYFTASPVLGTGNMFMLF
jgi:hypothetical protein